MLRLKALCSGLAEPFSLQGAVPDGSQVNFYSTPSGDTGGSYTYEGSGGFRFNGAGDYTITPGEGETKILSQTDSTGCVGMWRSTFGRKPEGHSPPF